MNWLRAWLLVVAAAVMLGCGSGEEAAPPADAGDSTSTPTVEPGTETAPPTGDEPTGIPDEPTPEPEPKGDGADAAPPAADPLGGSVIPDN